MPTIFLSAQTVDVLCPPATLRHDVAHGAVVRWSDVEFDASNDTIKTRKAMEERFAKA